MGFYGFGKKYGVKKGNKFNANMTAGGDSDFETLIYRELCLLETKGEISNVRRQVRLRVIDKVMGTHDVVMKTKTKSVGYVAVREHFYTADFAYYDNDMGKYVLCEVKGEMTYKLQDYRLRRDLAMARIAAHNRRGHGQWVFLEIINFTSKGKRGIRRFLNGRPDYDTTSGI